jgi:hypothetical protein
MGTTKNQKQEQRQNQREDNNNVTTAGLVVVGHGRLDLPTVTNKTAFAKIRCSFPRRSIEPIPQEAPNLSYPLRAAWNAGRIPRHQKAPGLTALRAELANINARS